MRGSARERSGRTAQLAAWLDRASVKRVSTRIHNVVWDKLAWNAAFNAITTLTRRSVREALDDATGTR